MCSEVRGLLAYVQLAPTQHQENCKARSADERSPAMLPEWYLAMTLHQPRFRCHQHSLSLPRCVATRVGPHAVPRLAPEPCPPATGSPSRGGAAPRPAPQAVVLPRSCEQPQAPLRRVPRSALRASSLGEPGPHWPSRTLFASSSWPAPSRGLFVAGCTPRPFSFLSVSRPVALHASPI